MGVPVLTQEGGLHAGRVGYSLLARVGLTEWVAKDEEEYVNKACEFAGDLATLSRVRAGLRHRMTHSSLCDALQFTQDVDSAYRNMWRSWCKGSDLGRRG